VNASVVTRERNQLRSPGGPTKSAPIGRQCACGQHTVGGQPCEKCAKGTSLFDRPHKAVGPAPDDHGEKKPRPRNGAATIQCDGSGGWEIDYGTWAGATCGTKGCVTAHESSHIGDWQAKWPKGCVGQPRGYLPQGDPPDNPLMSVDEYNKFLKDSECRAHTADLDCAEALPKSGACKQKVEHYISLTKKQKAKWCGRGLSTLARIGLVVGGGVVGGLVGNWIGDGLGAGIGAGLGALAGGLLPELF